jgi:hypothetical protein
LVATNSLSAPLTRTVMVVVRGIALSFASVFNITNNEHETRARSLRRLSVAVFQN